LAVPGFVEGGGGRSLEVEQHRCLCRWVPVSFAPFIFISCEISFWFDLGLIWIGFWWGIWL